MQVIHYTDPGCPFAFSAEPTRLRLEWTYGDQLEWETRMVVIGVSAEQYAAKGITPERFSGGQTRLHAQHGMPFDTTPKPRVWATRPSCLAVVATRRHAPEQEALLLRQLRVLGMGGSGLWDDQATLDEAATNAGIDPADLRAWMDEPESEHALEADMAAARAPLPAGLALDSKLAPAEDGTRRYSAPTMEFRHGDHVLVAPGFQPWATYELVIANLQPSLERRGAPEDPRELLAWAPYPLATAEVAAIMDVSIDDARAELGHHAAFVPAGSDGFWHT